MPPVYALNLFDVTDADEYRAYARRSMTEVPAHGGRVVAMGRHRQTVTGTANYAWVLFDRLEDLRPVLANERP